MSRVLEIHDVRFDGDYLLVTALVDDAVLVRGQTLLDPAEWGPALCRGSMLMDPAALIPASERELCDLLSAHVDDWAPIDWDAEHD
jgi:hypothetical protein